MKQLQIRQYPKLIEEFGKENFNLKTLSTALLALMLINSLILVFVVRRGPTVIPLAADGSVARVESGVTAAQVQAAVREYLAARYTWTDSSIQAQLKRAEVFVSPALVPAFQKAMLETLKYVKEKKVTQRIYARSVEVDFKSQQVSIVADRITEFDGLKAANEMQIVLSFVMGERTPANPWGIFITKEAERAPQ